MLLATVMLVSLVKIGSLIQSSSLIVGVAQILPRYFVLNQVFNYPMEPSGASMVTSLGTAVECKVGMEVGVQEYDSTYVAQPIAITTLRLVQSRNVETANRLSTRVATGSHTSKYSK